MRAIALCIGLLLSANVPAAKPQVTPSPPARSPLELKGIRPGMPFDQVAAMFPGAECHAGATYHSCMVETTVAETHVFFNVSEKGGVVDDAYLSRFDGNNFQEAVAAFRAKYGAPDSTQAFVRKNNLGAHFFTDVYVWNFPEGRLIVAEFNETGAIDPSHPRIEIQSAAHVAAEESAAARAAKDL